MVAHLLATAHVVALSGLQVYQELEELQQSLYKEKGSSLLPSRQLHTPKEDFYLSQPLNQPEESDESLEASSGSSCRSLPRKTDSVDQPGKCPCLLPHPSLHPEFSSRHI